MPIRDLQEGEEVLPLQAAQTKAPRIRDLSPDEQVIPIEQPSEPGFDAARSIGTGVANTLGAPADLMGMLPDAAVPPPIRISQQLLSAGLRAAGVDVPQDRPVTGSENIRAMLDKAGLAYTAEAEPTTLGHRVVREISGAAVPFAGMAGRGARLLKSGVEEGANLLDRAAIQAAKTPIKSGAAEAVAASGAAVGGQVAEHYTDSPWKIALAELAGGITPSAIANAPGAVNAVSKVMPVRATVRGMTQPFTKAGGERIASKRLQSLAADPKAAAALLTGDELLPGIDLPPAQMTGDPRLLAQQKAVLDVNPEMDARFTERLAKANQEAAKAATDFGGDPARTSEVLEQRRAEVISQVDTMAAEAARQAQEAVEKLGPDATERQLANAVRTRVERTAKAGRRLETKLWNDINRDLPGDMSNGEEEFRSILSRRTEFADNSQIPDYVTQAFTPGEHRPQVITSGHLTDLRSRLLDDAAEARKNGQAGKANILGRLSAALLDDLDAVGDPAVATATGFSRKFNDRFTRGAVGDLLGYASDRGLKVNPDETLEFIDRGEDIGRANRLDALIKASPRAKPKVEEYLRAAFTRQATDGGVVDPKAAKHFLNEKYNETLTNFPDLRAEIEQAVASSEKAGRRATRAKKLTKALNTQKQSRTALYLDGTVGEEWKRVLSSKDPVSASKELAKQVRGDKVALQGLKQGFVEELLSRSRTAEVDAEGGYFTSGKRFRKELADNADVASALLDPEEHDRLRKVAATYARIEAKPGAAEKILDDGAHNILEFLTAWTGVKIGGKVAEGTNNALFMTSRTAAIFRRFGTKITTTQAHKVITAAIDDKDLYRALLVGPDSSPEKQRAAEQTINAWLAVPLSPGPAVQEPETEQEPLPQIQ